MPKLGCATKLIVFALVIILAFFGIGFVFGPLGASFFGIETPSFLNVSKPHVELPAEGLFEVAGFPITNTVVSAWVTIVVLFRGGYRI